MNRCYGNSNAIVRNGGRGGGGDGDGSEKGELEVVNVNHDMIRYVRRNKSILKRRSGGRGRERERERNGEVTVSDVFFERHPHINSISTGVLRMTLSYYAQGPNCIHVQLVTGWTLYFFLPRPPMFSS